MFNSKKCVLFLTENLRDKFVGDTEIDTDNNNKGTRKDDQLPFALFILLLFAQYHNNVSFLDMGLFVKVLI
jgi:hypothetical protein